MGTRYKGSKKEVRALNTYIKLIRAANSLSSRINIHLSKTGLTESQYNVLDALYHLGPLTQKDIGRKLFKSGGNITMVIDNLEKRKLKYHQALTTLFLERQELFYLKYCMNIKE